MLSLPSAASAQFYAGALGGFEMLSAGAQSVVKPTGAAFSLYEPDTGPSLDLFAGRHVTDYLSIQVAYGWDRNDLTLSATSSSPEHESFYQEARSSYEQSVLGEVLVYFRKRRSWVRPYLSVGTGVVRFHSSQTAIGTLAGAPIMPPEQFTSTAIALPVAVGIDLRIHDGWRFRYTFREINRNNPVSAVLSPPGHGNLKIFQNAFGILKTF